MLPFPTYNDTYTCPAPAAAAPGIRPVMASSFLIAPNSVMTVSRLPAVIRFGPKTNVWATNEVFTAWAAHR